MKEKNKEETLTRLCRSLIPKLFRMLIQPKPKDMMLLKKSGIKLHIGVDVLGLPHMIMMTAANTTDRKGAVRMIEYYSEQTQKLKIPEENYC